MIAIFDPLPDIAMHVEKPEGVGLVPHEKLALDIKNVARRSAQMPSAADFLALWPESHSEEKLQAWPAKPAAQTVCQTGMRPR
jgi:hypothetical protein